MAELVTVADAAKRVGRSVSTVRRWLRDGALTRYEGEAPAHGGSASVLVDADELHALVVTSGAHPAPGGGRSPSPGLGLRDEGEVARLRAELVEARADARVARAELDAAQRIADAERGAVARTLAALEAHLADERGHRVAAEAERDALRVQLGGSWWRRLLPG